MTKKRAAEPWEEEEEGRRNKEKEEETGKLTSAARLCTLRTLNK
jgi:hypothetical protein